MRKAVLFLTFAMLAPAQEPLATIRGENIRGAALHGQSLYTWGNRLLRWNIATGGHQVLGSSTRGGFGEGGCVGARDVVYLQDGVESGPLVAIAPGGARTELDRNVEMHNCVAPELLGHHGVLIIDHYGQVRFYEGPGKYQEVYSFYTPSRQAGLLMADVDGDGLMDIFAGNYWIRSPKAFDLPWRLFAINTRHETPDSATMTLTLCGKQLYAAQGHMRDGTLFRYTPTADPTQLWTEQGIASGLRFPHGLTSDASIGIAVGENGGPGSRLFLARDGEHLAPLGTTDGVHTLVIVGGRILTVGAESITWWDPAPLKGAHGQGVQRRK
jgi:hypothetical protein